MVDEIRMIKDIGEELTTKGSSSGILMYDNIDWITVW